ncbi:MAG: hypothetical protein RIA10_17195 [Amphiplicatus sp.]
MALMARALIEIFIVDARAVRKFALVIALHAVFDRRRARGRREAGAF